MALEDRQKVRKASQLTLVRRAVTLERMPKKKLVRPALFIGSSKESLNHAYAIQQNLDDDAETTVWDQGIFKLTKTSVASLIKALDKSDFAIFVLAR